MSDSTNSAASAEPSGAIQKLLHQARTSLGMDVGFISEFSGSSRFFRYVDAEGASPIAVGSSMHMDEGYCRGIVEGWIPELIPDTAFVPSVADLEVTRAIPIGAHLSVPLYLEDGRLFGTFCCFSHKPDPELDAVDLAALRKIAESVVAQLKAMQA